MTKPQQFLIYQSEDGSTRIDVMLEAETLWLNQKQLTELFGKAKGTISEHIKPIFEDGELDEHSVVRLFRTTAADGKQYVVAHYNLDMILAFGFRVRSPVGVRFRQWANEKLKKYIVKGFVLDDARLKNPGKGRDYFDELTRRLQDIRTSERRFYSENHRHLRHQRGLRRAPTAHSAVFRHGAKQGALRHPRPDRRRVDHQPRG
ncbi:MAG: hypothetical protein GJU75_04610 [Acidithiobacillus ferriphilus]|jgi:hypothetical protein|nr:RhuM family protein [Acidithiobacillus ferriphilus]MBW9254424.1 hypothetical protein [Acidithiobacillus ferriphilus]